MTRHGGLALILLTLGGCAGFEDNVRDLNRSLYRTWSGNDTRVARPEAISSSTAAEATPCYSAETGLLYVSQTGRCAAGYNPVPAAEAERAFGRRATETATTTRPQTTATPPAPPNQALALCYDDGQGQVFEAASCPAGSRWVTAAEASSIQQAQLAGASWCYFSGRRLLYRSRACRPGDQNLSVAQADEIWERLAPDRRPRQRPTETTGAAQPVPPVQAAPRGGVSATPLPSSR